MVLVVVVVVVKGVAVVRALLFLLHLARLLHQATAAAKPAPSFFFPPHVHLILILLYLRTHNPHARTLLWQQPRRIRYVGVFQGEWVA
jgi:hypothetical protein